MKFLNRKPIFKLIIWLALEIILNIIGLDDLADYSEFIFEKDMMTAQYIIVQ